MSLQAPMSRIPVRNRNDNAGHKRSGSMSTKLEQMQQALQERIRQESVQKLCHDKEQRVLQVYAGEQERTNRQVSKFGYHSGKSLTRAQPGTNVGGVRNYFQSKRLEDTSAGNGLRRKPPLPVHHQKNSAGRDRANPLTPLNYRSPQLEYDEVGMLGQGSSPTGIRHSPKPQSKSKLAGRAGRRVYGTPNDSGNESSGYEDQNMANLTYKVNKTKPTAGITQYQASSEEDLNTPPPKQPSFQEWKMSRGKAGSTRATPTNMHNGYSSDAPASDFMKFQAERDQEREERLQRYRNQHPGRQEDFGSSPVISNPSHYDSDDEAPPPSNRSRAPKGSADRSVQVAAELKRKEQELLDMIQKQQRELESMKQQRAEEEAQEKRETLRLLEQRRQKQREMAAQATPASPPPSPPAPSPPPVLRKARRVRSQPPARLPPPAAPTTEASEAARFYLAAAEAASGDAAGDAALVACALCGRRFAPERVGKHEATCAKLQKKDGRRRTFDAAKMRTGGTDMAQYAGADRPKPKKKDTGDWRKKREDFIRALRYAKQAAAVEKSGGSVADLPPPPRTENAHYVACPWCERRFAPDTAERHIPKCKDIKARPAPVRARAMRKGR